LYESFANTTMTPIDPQARQEPTLDSIAPAAASNDNVPESQPDARLAELQAKHAEVSDAYLRAKAEAEGSGDFSPLWSGQNASGCKEVPAARLTLGLAAG